MDLQSGDILSDKEAAAVSAWQELHDMISDAVEGGRIKEEDCPDDYRAIVQKLEECVRLENAADAENESD